MSRIARPGDSEITVRLYSPRSASGVPESVADLKIRLAVSRCRLMERTPAHVLGTLARGGVVALWGTAAEVRAGSEGTEELGVGLVSTEVQYYVRTQMQPGSRLMCTAYVVKVFSSAGAPTRPVCHSPPTVAGGVRCHSPLLRGVTLGVTGFCPSPSRPQLPNYVTVSDLGLGEPRSMSVAVLRLLWEFSWDAVAPEVRDGGLLVADQEEWLAGRAVAWAGLSADVLLVTTGSRNLDSVVVGVNDALARTRRSVTWRCRWVRSGS
jgi:hypothetical protein